MQSRSLYRFRQFWAALWSNPSQSDEQLLNQVLTPPQAALFRQMHPSEQLHAIRVFRTLRAQGHTHPDLGTAALLHDVGKTRFPLHLWERVMVVFGKALFSEKVKTWGKRAPKGWARAFVIAEQHPAWGAQIAEQHGASPLAIRLIQRHQEATSAAPASLEDQLLELLQSVDDTN